MADALEAVSFEVSLVIDNKDSPVSYEVSHVMNKKETISFEVNHVMDKS